MAISLKKIPRPKFVILRSSFSWDLKEKDKLDAYVSYLKETQNFEGLSEVIESALWTLINSDRTFISKFEKGIFSKSNKDTSIESGKESLEE